MFGSTTIRSGLTTALSDLWQHLHRQLFPVLLEEIGELGEKDRRFIAVVSLLPLGPLLPRYDWQGIGCPPHARVWLRHAFIAKEVYQYLNREVLIESLKARPTLRRLCGWARAEASAQCLDLLPRLRPVCAG